MVNDSCQCHLLIVIDTKVELLEHRQREREGGWSLLLLKKLLAYLVDVVVLLCVADGSLLELGTLHNEDNIVVSSLEYLHQHYHLLVLHEIKGASAEVEWVGTYHILDLGAQLGHHGLVEMAVAPGVARVGRDGTNS